VADVFLSYASEDCAKPMNLALALESAGLSVWLDRDLHSGAVFAMEVDGELAGALSVVVWSSASVA